MKPGPKKGWITELRAELELHRAEHFELMDSHLRLAHRVHAFNRVPFWSKVLFLLKGGHV